MKKLITTTLLTILLATTPTFASNFADTQDESVTYAYQNSLMKGTSQNKFEPNTILTRAQFACTLANLTKETPRGYITFKDVKKDSYYYNSVLWAYNNKIISGTSANTFSPNTTLNREQVASMVAGYWKKYLSETIIENVTFDDLNQASSWARESVKFTAQIFKDAGIIQTNNFEPKKAFTRLETAKLVSHLHKLKEITPVTKEKEIQLDKDEPPMNRFIKLNNEIVKNWWSTLKEINNESVTPTKEEQDLLKIINDERQKLGLNPLKLMKNLQPIAKKRAQEAHDWYRQYAFNSQNAPTNQKTPYIRPITGTEFYKNLELNKDIFTNTKLYQFMNTKDKIKIMQSTIENSFAESLIYGSNKASTEDLKQAMLTTPYNYKFISNPKYTHVCFAGAMDDKTATVAQIFFNENEGKTLLKELQLN